MAVVVALRVPLLLSAGLLTVLAFAMPAQAEAGCGVSLEGASAQVGGTCTADAPAEPLEDAAVCIGVQTTDGYLWESRIAGIPYFTDAETVPGCEAGADGPTRCEAWQYDADLSSPWLYPNAGADCTADGVGRACVELLDSDLLFTNDVLGVHTLTPCGSERIPWDGNLD